MRALTICENCAKKNRKCDRNKPECSNCLSSSTACTYPDHRKTGPKPGQTKALEERLRKLEAIVKALHLDEDGDSINQILAAAQSPSQSQTSLSPSARNGASNHSLPFREDLLNLFAEHICPTVCIVAPEDMRNLAMESPLLLHALFALTSLFAPPSMVPAQYASNREMSDDYFAKATSLLKMAFKRPTHHSVLSLFTLLFTCLRTDRASEGYYYYTVGVRMALSIGLNKEETFEAQGLSEIEKDARRIIWSCVFQADRMISGIRNEAPQIRDEDLLCAIPNEVGVHSTHPMDQTRLLQISILSSTGWYIPSIPTKSIDTCYFMLQKINGRVNMFLLDCQQTRQIIPEEELLLRRTMLYDSLQNWYNNLPDTVKQIPSLINSDTPPPHNVRTWRAAFLYILYNSIRVSLFRPWVRNAIMNNPKIATTSYAFTIVFAAASETAFILSGFLKHNPNFQFISPFFSFCVFGVGLVLPAACLLELSPSDHVVAERSLDVFLTSLNQLGNHLNMGKNQKSVLERLRALRDPITITKLLDRLNNLKSDMGLSNSPPMREAEVKKEDFPSSFSTPSSSGSPIFTNIQPNSTSTMQDMPPFPRAFPTDLSAFAFDIGTLEQAASMSNPYSDLMVGFGPEDNILFSFNNPM